VSETARKAIAEGLGAAPIAVARETHAGLYFDRYAPVQIAGDDAGKCAPDARETFIDRLVSLAIPKVYPGAFARWKRALAATGAIVAEVRAYERLLVGHGNPSGLEVGLTLHRTYGVPYLPGTALKGLLNHYLATWGVLEDGGEAWRGVEYVGNVPTEPPGAFHGAIFGAPAIPGHDAGRRGAVCFEDALYIPGSLDGDVVLLPDVVTPHQDLYYKTQGVGEARVPPGRGPEEAWPNEWDEPVPVGFVSVRPGARFLLAVSGQKEAAELAMAHLLDALETQGVGAKTRAGYGRLERCVAEREAKPADAPSVETRSQEEAATGIAKLLRALNALDQTDPKRGRDARFADTFANLDELDAFTPEERRQAYTVFKTLEDKYGVIRNHPLTPRIRRKLSG